MNRHVNAIAGRLSLRHPQRRSLEILDRITEIAPPKRDTDPAAALAAIASEFSSCEDFERDFPSVCFALATGVGKTRLMGAFISYLHLAHGHDNFFVLAPNLTIYNKLITDFTPNTPKYVFSGIAEFATEPPAVITGDNYESQASTLFDVVRRCKINIFNISKINTEVRGGHAPRIRRLSEYIGESYFDYLAALPDLVLIMDESHRYRASAGVRAINELKPVLGLELTATPQVESGNRVTRFKNIVFDYPLGRAMADGFIKEPAVVTRRDFNAASVSDVELERLKLEDGIHLHESIKVELQTYALEAGKPFVKPFVLVIARDTTHAADLVTKLEANDFFGGAYKGRVIRVDSSDRGAEEKEDTVQRLLRVEDPDEPTEIVVHVNMLKEGWDVRNLYTIIPLRAANARTLIEQSIGRGLRLPYGARTNVASLDRLNIVAHDRFQEIVAEASKPESIVQFQQIILDPDTVGQKLVTVIAPPRVELELGLGPQPSDNTVVASGGIAPVFNTPQDRKAAEIAVDVVRRIALQPAVAPTPVALQTADVRARIVAEVKRIYEGAQLPLPGAAPVPDFVRVVQTVTDVTVAGTIAIPRIIVVPRGEVQSGFHLFTLNLSQFRPQPVSQALFAQYLRTGGTQVILLQQGGQIEQRPEDYVVAGLVDFDDISYDKHADLLYQLAGQVIAHLRTYLEENDLPKVLQFNQREIARLIHAQMQAHYWENAAGGYVEEVRQGFVPLKGSNYSARASETKVSFRQQPAHLDRIGQLVFEGFERALFSACKFQSNQERIMAIILDREAEKWFRPARDQFEIWYQQGTSPARYQPDFVAETRTEILMIETKASNQMEDAEVVLKRDAAVWWCGQATKYSTMNGGKPWKYVLVPDREIAENMSLSRFAEHFACQ